jgi:HSP20 family protein
MLQWQALEHSKTVGSRRVSDYIIFIVSATSEDGVERAFMATPPPGRPVRGALSSARRCVMSTKTFTIDIGRIMDEALKMAQGFGEAFEEGMAEGFQKAGEQSGNFNWKHTTDFYPHYSYPPTNIYLTRDRTLIFEFALAGFSEKDVTLQFQGDYLLLSARLPAGEEREADVHYFKRRLKFKAVDRQRYYVPADRFDQEKVGAHYSNGLLKIKVPARDDQSEAQEIKINIT